MISKIKLFEINQLTSKSILKRVLTRIYDIIKNNNIHQYYFFISNIEQLEQVTIYFVSEYNDLEISINGHIIDYISEDLKKYIEPYENFLTIHGSIHSIELRVVFSDGNKNKLINSLLLNKNLLQNVEKHPEILYILNSKNTIETSSYCNLYFPAYDVGTNNFRLLSWIWTNGLIVDYFVNEFKRTGERYLLEEAESLVRKLGDFILVDGKNNKGIEVRWDLSKKNKNGIIRWAAPNDVAYLVYYGFYSLYKVNNDVNLKEKVLSTANWILSEGMSKNGKVFVGYDIDRKKWIKSWCYVDVGFVSLIFKAAYEISGDLIWKEILLKFVKYYVNAFYSGQGYFYNSVDWSIKKGKTIFSRGQAWALIALLNAYEFSGSDEYLKIMTEVCDFLLVHQNPNGSWNYRLRENYSGECAKSTPVLAYYLIESGKYMRNHERIYECVKKAADWCEENQLKDKSKIGFGCIHSKTQEGSILTNNNEDIAFLYSAIYYYYLKQKLNDQRIF